MSTRRSVPLPVHRLSTLSTRAVLLAALLTPVLLVAAARDARAFATVGHKVLEAAAYRQMLVDDEGKPNKEGTAILRRLIADGALTKPPCIHAEAGCGAEERTDDPLLWWPVPGTDMPDMIMARQFSKAGQCYHFMASVEDEAKSTPGKPSDGLRVWAPNRCVRQLDEIFRYVVAAPAEARDRRMGTYELLHAIADSYSRAHTERDYVNWDRRGEVDPMITFLRVWQPTVRLPWSGESLETRHEIFEERDDNFIDRFTVVDGRPCSSHIEKPYFVPFRCLSVEGRLAVRAMREALETIDKVRESAKGRKLGEVDLRPWTAFTRRHLPLKETSTGDPGLPSEHTPLLSLGVLTRYENERVAGAASLDGRIEARVFYGGRIMDPITFLPSVSIGTRSVVGRAREFVYRSDAGLGIQAFNRFYFSVTPLSFEAAKSSDLTSFDALANLRVDWFPHPRLAMSFISPEYSWPTGDWHLAFGVAAAYVFGRETGGAAPVDASTPVAGALDPSALVWTPPDTGDVELRSGRGPTILQLFAGAAGGRPESARSTTGKLRQGLELLLQKRNAWNERRTLAIAFGVASSVEFGRGDRYPALTVEGYAAPRLYIAGPLGVLLQLGVDTGNSIDRKPGMVARAGALLSFGALDLIVESPTWTSARWGWLPEELLGLRLSVEALRL